MRERPPVGRPIHISIALASPGSPPFRDLRGHSAVFEAVCDAVAPVRSPVGRLGGRRHTIRRRVSLQRSYSIRSWSRAERTQQQPREMRLRPLGTCKRARRRARRARGCDRQSSRSISTRPARGRNACHLRQPVRPTEAQLIGCRLRSRGSRRRITATRCAFGSQGPRRSSSSKRRTRALRRSPGTST